MLFSCILAAQWCRDMIPKEQWDIIGSTFMFTTAEQREWFKLVWIGSDEEI